MYLPPKLGCQKKIPMIKQFPSVFISFLNQPFDVLHSMNYYGTLICQSNPDATDFYLFTIFLPFIHLHCIQQGYRYIRQKSLVVFFLSLWVVVAKIGWLYIKNHIIFYHITVGCRLVGAIFMI